MGQKSATDTLFGIIAAFIERRTWSQADLARRLETRTETVRKHLTELTGGGFKLEREEEPPHVYWSVPKDWFPGALLFKADEVPDLVRILHRARRGPLRDKVLGLVTPRLASVGVAAPELDDKAVVGPAAREDEERWLSILEDAASSKFALRMRYFTASRSDESRRHVSVHRVEHGGNPQFVATCHKAGALRRFRVSNVLDASLDRAEPHRAVDPETLERFCEESFGGFRSDGPAIECAFFVASPASAWVARNLPDPRIERRGVEGGARFSVRTSAVEMLARFVVGLGDAATVETPELARAVADIARGALANVAPTTGRAKNGAGTKGRATKGRATKGKATKGKPTNGEATNGARRPR